MSEIAAASKEQSHGIEQVNKAVADMDRVVQQNAANAEENASASEEMNSQAEQMRGFVDELASMVGGSGAAGVQEKEPLRIALGSARKKGREQTSADRPPP